MYVVPPVCPFSPEPWGHQMKQQVIGFKRNKMLYFPVKHKVNLQNSLLQDAAGCCRCQKFQKTNSQIYGGKIKWAKLKLKVLALAQDIFRQGSGWAVTHFGVVSLCACVIPWLYNWLPPETAGWVDVVWPFPFSGPDAERVFSLWKQDHAAVPALHTCTYL